MNLIHVRRPEGTVVVEKLGEGPAVVCVPGLGDWRQSYRRLVPALVAAGHSVYSMDLRGHGASDVSFTSWTASDIGDDVVALLEQEDLHDVAVVGCSIGGGAAAWVAAEAPDRVARLVMLNPFVRDMPADWWMKPLMRVLFARPWAVRAWGWYHRTLFQTFDGDHAEVEAAMLANLREPGRMRAATRMALASKADIAARLAEISQPTLVVMGANDPDFPDPAAEGETLRGLLGGTVTVEVLDRCGHYPQIDRVDATADLIVAHLRNGAVHAA